MGEGALLAKHCFASARTPSRQRLGRTAERGLRRVLRSPLFPGRPIASTRRKNPPMNRPNRTTHPPVGYDARPPFGTLYAMSKNNEKAAPQGDVTQDQAEDAVRTLLRWAGEDPSREGLLDTPRRVAEAYGDWFSGYRDDPRAYMERTFEEVAGYDELIVLRDIEYESHCEHHMAPIIGRVHVGYLPAGKVVGISKLARVVEAYARRFQVQEKMTAQIAQCIQDVLQPIGVGVVVEGAHECMTTRGIHKRGVSMVTSKMLGSFRDDARTRAEFLRFIEVGGKR